MAEFKQPNALARIAGRLLHRWRMTDQEAELFDRLDQVLQWRVVRYDEIYRDDDEPRLREAVAQRLDHLNRMLVGLGLLILARDVHWTFIEARTAAREGAASVIGDSLGKLCRRINGDNYRLSPKSYYFDPYLAGGRLSDIAEDLQCGIGRATLEMMYTIVSPKDEDEKSYRSRVEATLESWFAAHEEQAKILDKMFETLGEKPWLFN